MRNTENKTDVVSSDTPDGSYAASTLAGSIRSFPLSRLENIETSGELALAIEEIRCEAEILDASIQDLESSLVQAPFAGKADNISSIEAELQVARKRRALLEGLYHEGSKRKAILEERERGVILDTEYQLGQDFIEKLRKSFGEFDLATLALSAAIDDISSHTTALRRIRKRLREGGRSGDQNVIFPDNLINLDALHELVRALAGSSVTGDFDRPPLDVAVAPAQNGMVPIHGTLSDGSPGIVGYVEATTVPTRRSRPSGLRLR